MFIVLLALYNIPNISNRISLAIIVAALVIVICAASVFVIRKRFNGSNVESSLDHFNKNWLLHVIRISIVIILLCRHYICDDYTEITNGFDNLMISLEQESEYATVFQFLEYNDIIVPRCYKQLSSILSEFMSVADEYDGDRTRIYNDWYTDNAERINKLTDSCYNDCSEFNILITVFLITLVIERVYNKLLRVKENNNRLKLTISK